MLAKASVVCLVAEAFTLAKALRKQGISGPRERHLASVATGSLLAAGAITLIQLANNHFFDDLNDQIVPSATDPEDRLLRTLEYVARVPPGDGRTFDAKRIRSRVFRLLGVLEAASPFHVCARTVLTGGTDAGGPCGSLSRALIVLLKRAGINARKALLYDEAGLPAHTVVEVKLGDRWIVVDPSYGTSWRRRRDAELATAAEIAGDRQLLEGGIETLWDYPRGLYPCYRHVQHVRWEKAPGLKQLKGRLGAWIGDDRVREIPTPYVYERPGYLFSGLFFAVAAASLANLAHIRAKG